MNPFGLDVTALLVWGVVAHLVADWLLQSDWMAANKAKRRELHAERWGGMGHRGYASVWWDRHPAALVHAGLHGVALAFVFGWLAAALAVVHLVIDTRGPVARWARLIRQTPPVAPVWAFRHGWRGHIVDLRAEPKAEAELRDHADGEPGSRESQGLLVDMGLLVRVNVDQVFHVVTIASAALLVGALS